MFTGSPFVDIILLTGGLVTGAAFTVTVRAWRRFRNPKLQPIWFVEECKVGDYMEKPRVMWRSGKLPYKYAEILKNDLANDAQRLGEDSWFRVVRDGEQKQ